VAGLAQMPMRLLSSDARDRTGGHAVFTRQSDSDAISRRIASADVRRFGISQFCVRMILTAMQALRVSMRAMLVSLGPPASPLSVTIADIGRLRRLEKVPSARVGIPVDFVDADSVRFNAVANIACVTDGLCRSQRLAGRQLPCPSMGLFEPAAPPQMAVAITVQGACPESVPITRRNPLPEAGIVHRFHADLLGREYTI
jgi:hypothetical protein